MGGQGSGTQPSKQGSSLREQRLIQQLVEIQPTCKAVSGADRCLGCHRSSLDRQIGIPGKSCHAGIAAGRQPGFSTCHGTYSALLLALAIGTRDDSLNRGSSLGAGSSIGRHCSAKAFTVASHLEAAGGLEGGGGTYVAATGVRNTLRQVRTNGNLVVKRWCCYRGVSTSV